MKLISCYIENFGGLSQYRLDFQEGLTVVLADNGFGKTTLAEFLRTMFYGFPRAGKSLDKNPRKKYTPWNSGVCGGNLIFEHEGRRYRIDRRFGATPKGDTFELTDAITHTKSSDFTANIGVELFGLDADSFERSTYMPQLHDHATVATTGIQSKLGDLVHDTGDIGNYDNAIRALREKRSAYIPFKGRGGSVAEAASRISDLEEQIDQTEALRPALEELLRQLRELSDTRDSKTGARESIRAELQQRAQYDAKVSAEKQLQGMEHRKNQLQEQQQSLLARYPKGLPHTHELHRIEYLLGRLPALTPQAETQTERDAQATIDELGGRFAAGVPDGGFYARLRRLDKELIEAETALKNAALTDGEQTQLAQLETFFAPGLPDEALPDRCQQALRERSSAEDRLEHLTMPEADRLRLEQLDIFFAGGVPEESELEDQQALLDRISGLRQENLRISAAVEAQVRAEIPEKPTHKGMILPMLLGLTLAVLGVVGVILDDLVPGVIALGLGVMLFAAGFALKLKQDVARELRAAAPAGSVMDDADRIRLRENTARIDDLERQVTAFVARYITDGRPLQEKHSQIRADRARYLELRQRRRDIQTESVALRARSDDLTGELTMLLSPYFGADADFDQQLPLLKLRMGQYRELTRKQEQSDARAVQLREECETLRGKLDAALSPYFPQDIDGYGTAIAQLESEAQRYSAALSHLSEQRRLHQARAGELAELREELGDFARKYALTAPLTEPENLHRLRSDIQTLPELRRQLQEAAEELRDFRREHGALLSLPDRAELRDPEILKRSETHLTQELRELEQQLAALELQKRNLYTRLDAIPQLCDELEQWRQIRLRDSKNCALLDQTIQFLEQSREALSTRYMGSVQHRFVAYMNRISGEAQERIFVTPELEVTVERLGEPRALDYFSAGQTDIVTLCMRLALADALFEGTRPFMILDDPFVNLDDRNLEQALSVLRQLSKDHQILYLVCSENRVP